MLTRLSLLGAALTALAVAPAAQAQEVSKKIFLNRCADTCEIELGFDNSRINRSSIPNQQFSVVQPFAHSDEVWNQVVQCVKELYAPYDVEVTDVDPGDTEPHHEAIVAGTPQDIGHEAGIGGLGLGGCNLRDNAISYTFANVYGPNPLTICSVIGQESAHTYGLDHEMECSDPMTYLSACGRQFFRDQNIPCGEFSERDCSCGATVQNSHRWLRSQLGPNETPVPGPTTEVSSPTDGAQVQNGFRVDATATHIRGVDRVEFWVNGTMLHMMDGPAPGDFQEAYFWQTPQDLADGIIDLEVKAYNDIQSETVVALTVTKGEPCSQDEQCNDGQYCEEGRCKFPVATGEIGDECSAGSECISGLCPLEGDSGYCSQDCDPLSPLMVCPDGFECKTAGSSGVCWPENAGGCGCAATGSRGAGGTALLVLLAGLLAWRRRR